MRIHTLAILSCTLITATSLRSQAAQLVGSVINATAVIRSTAGFANATDVVGACRDNAGFYWTTCKSAGQVYLIRLSPAGLFSSFIFTGFPATVTVVDLAFDATNNRIWVHAPPSTPLVYDTNTGAFVGSAQGPATVGNGIAWNGGSQVHLDGNQGWQAGTLVPLTISPVGPTLQGLMYSPASTTWWGTRPGGDPGQMTNHEFTPMPNAGATQPPHLEGIVHNGDFGGLPRGCEAWRDPTTNEWLGVFCQQGDTASFLYTARLSEPTGAGCGGPVFIKGPAVVHDRLYAEAVQQVGFTWLLISLLPGTFNNPAFAPGCTLHLDVFSGVVIGPLVPQGLGIVSISLPISSDPTFREMPLWFQLGAVNLQFQIILSEGRSAAIKNTGSFPIQIIETFASAAMRDGPISSGAWNNGARPGLIGGDGRHGSFDPTLGTLVGQNEYTWDTTAFTIPASHSLTGLSYTVTDGKFYFTDLTVPAGVTVNFVGPVPPQIRVRGEAYIAGTIRSNGAAMTTFNARGTTTTTAPFIPGQPGGLGGAGGGRGGRGGNECQGAGPIIVGGEVLTNGKNGDTVQLLAGHAYANQVLNTGGRGSAMNPPNGIAAPNTPLVGFVYRAYFAPGGSGGGFPLTGGISAVTPVTNLQVGPIPAGGSSFNPWPPIVLGDSLNHFTMGGSGGGGGATHAYGTIYVSGDVYIAGSGGSGGGGAVAIRAGNDVTVTPTAALEAKGGAGAIINARDPAGSGTNTNWGVSSPGGGGSGGSFLLQSGANLLVAGSVDTSGGDGSRTQNIGTASLNVISSGGAGSSGFYRFESAGARSITPTLAVPSYQSLTHSDSLYDRDNVTGSASLWYSTNTTTPPTWLDYELDVDSDGDGTIDITYTDTGAPGTLPANSPTDPVRIQFQGATLNQTTGLPMPGTIGPWRDFIGTGVGPGIGLDLPNGCRFMLTFNRGLFPNCIVGELRLSART